MGTCFWLSDRWAFGPVGHFSDYWGVGLMGCWNNGMAPCLGGVLGLYISVPTDRSSHNRSMVLDQVMAKRSRNNWMDKGEVGKRLSIKEEPCLLLGLC